MARSDLFHRFVRTLRIADACRVTGWSAREGVERARAQDAARIGRRSLLVGAGIASGAMALGCGVGDGQPSEIGSVRSALPRSSLNVGIVGAGLAGLSCANHLKRAGVSAAVYEASDRAGGRCFSLGGAFGGPVSFPGQVVERGGELIDNLHKTMIGYAKEFGLALEDYEKLPGDEFFHFGGVRVPEETVVEEYRQLVEAMHADLSKLSAGPIADAFSPFDAQLDYMTLRQYLETRGAGSTIKAVIEVVYSIEYGLDIDQLSALAFLMFIHADRRSRFQPFGVFSDERYHIVSGNQGVVNGLAGKIGNRLSYAQELVRVAKRSDGRIELTLRQGSRTSVAVHDAVVITVPFSVLRGVDLDASLGIPTWKRHAIDAFKYGTNAKMMVGFVEPFWRGQGSNGACYSDQPRLQSTWETNPSAATAQHAVLTNYAGGALGASFDPAKTQTQAAEFLEAVDKVFPGAKSKVARDGKLIRAHIEAWPRNPYAKGSYSANGPGYFTTIADNEAKPVGNLHFAGEHTSSFYEWQGFMEGAALSGIRAALEVLG